MVAQPSILPLKKVHYPDSDGKPMADSTLQFRWIVTFKESLEIIFADRPDVFIAGDLLWHPVEGNNKLCQAPDAMVVFGRPKGERRSYKQWEEDNLAPQVVFEVLSHSNTAKEMARKRLFYQAHGVDEYYIYDPEKNKLQGMTRHETALKDIPQMQGWISPRLGIRFELMDDTLEVFAPNGDRFLTPVEMAHQKDQIAKQRDRMEQQRDQMEQQRDQERDKAERLAQRLRDLGIDPDSV